MWECGRGSRGEVVVYAVEYVVELVPQKWALRRSLTSRPRPAVIHPHFIGSLFASSLGFAFLQSHIDLTEFCKLATDPSESLMNRRAVIWSLAHIATHPHGTRFLKEQCGLDFVETVETMALEDDFLSLRGTAMMILSFVVTNSSIREELTEKGWFCGMMGGNAICLPMKKQDQFFPSVLSENWLIPTCNHFRKCDAPTEVPGFQHLARSESQQEAGCGEYTQTNVCPSDIAIREEDVTEDEKKIIQLICGREWAR